MYSTNELFIRDEIATAMNQDFNSAAERVVDALGQDYSKTFNISSFETTSPEEILRKADEFGTVYIGQSDFKRVGKLGQKHLTNEIVIEVIAWILKKGDDTNQVSILRMALVEVMRNREFDFEKYSDWEIESSGSIDFSPETTENIYTGSGIIVKVKTGI